ncbi:hypothetical protein E1262_12540 [Jiangella aurantiaca]|uniref:Secreted protein n=1 Tax=Jiangella aurantiaca TaxID=2530373 RepID=A0A4R5ADW0_9ACTN|nr:hypothetical protein [Jiangella aurantiaca]TDD69470.1 hypothetical protein E1262_12540 [Jiangella aurantiaca]
MKNVLRGALVAGVAFAASMGVGATATAVPEVPEVPGTDSLPEIDILNNACILPWFWQGPVNFMVEDQYGSYSACNGAAEDGEGSSIADNACILPWFWQGPFNVLLGSQSGDYAACNGSEEIPADVQEQLESLLPEGVAPEDLTETELLELLPEGTQLLPQG